MAPESPSPLDVVFAPIEGGLVSGTRQRVVTDLK